MDISKKNALRFVVLLGFVSLFACHTGFGVFWFLGSALMGILYDISL